MKLSPFHGLSPEARAAAWKSLQICILYGATSMVISLLFKALLSSYHYENGKFIMLASQLVLTLAFCTAARRWGIKGVDVPEFSWPTLQASVVPGLLFVANVVIGWYGLELVNVPMFLCIRRTNALFTLAAEYLILQKVASPRVLGSVSVIVAGAIVAGYPTLNSDALGYAYTLGNNLMTAASMSVSKRWSDQTGLKAFGVIYYNALVALPICLLGAALKGEFSYTFNSFAHGYDPAFWGSLAFASLLGVYMSYVVMLCTLYNSALATSITGNVKDIASTLAAAVIFKDFVPNFFSVSGLILSFVGAGLFSVAKVAEVRSATAAAKPKAEREEAVADVESGAAATPGGSSSSSSNAVSRTTTLRVAGGRAASDADGEAATLLSPPRV